jgi:hypothetical protein
MLHFIGRRNWGEREPVGYRGSLNHLLACNTLLLRRYELRRGKRPDNGDLIVRRVRPGRIPAPGKVGLSLSQIDRGLDEALVEARPDTCHGTL